MHQLFFFSIVNPYIERIAGSNRVQTSIEISKKTFKKSTAKTIVLAGYEGSADALTGTLLASSLKGPLLLSPKIKLTDEIKTEIKRLGTKKVYILGGETRVPRKIETELKNLELEVERVSGTNRYGTAAQIAGKASKKTDMFLKCFLYCFHFQLI